MMFLKRTNTCGELRKSDAGKKIILNGWVENRRDHSGVYFVDLRDRYGKTQITFKLEVNKDAHTLANTLHAEDCIAIEGVIHERPEGNTNNKIPTGEIEVYVEKLEILNRSETPPIEVADTIETNLETRMKYRFLDLRRRPVMDVFLTRHKLYQLTRNYFTEKDFIEVETPFLTKSTPEGARDFLVPSRQQPGEFYALPQSPQLFKQMLMVSGFDKYFQIVKCFRDEDTRANRTLEFTQIDVEMSFATREDVMSVAETFARKVFREICNTDLGIPDDQPLPILSYAEAMDRFGKDAPDLRFGMEIKNISENVKASEFGVFANTIKGGGQVRGLVLEGGADNMPRREIDKLVEWVKQWGQKV